MAAHKYPISGLPLPPDSHQLIKNLTPDAQTLSVAAFRNEVLPKTPSLQRRARIIAPQSHFSFVNPFPAPFPYDIRPSKEEEESEEDAAPKAAEPELSRTERRELKKKKAQAAQAKKQANGGDEDEDEEDDDPLLVNPNHAAGKRMNLADLSAPRELTRRERYVIWFPLSFIGVCFMDAYREEKEKKEAKERYWKVQTCLLLYPKRPHNSRSLFSSMQRARPTKRSPTSLVLPRSVPNARLPKPSARQRRKVRPLSYPHAPSLGAYPLTSLQRRLQKRTRSGRSRWRRDVLEDRIHSHPSRWIAEVLYEICMYHYIRFRSRLSAMFTSILFRYNSETWALITCHTRTHLQCGQIGVDTGKSDG